jgi:hypothetical protein
MTHAWSPYGSVQNVKQKRGYGEQLGVRKQDTAYRTMIKKELIEM